MGIDLAAAVGRVHRSHHAVAAEPVTDERVFGQRVDHRRGVGHAGRLDQHPVDRSDLAPCRACEEVLERAYQVTLHAAADTARVEHQQGLVDLVDQMMIDPDRAELVDQHRRARELGQAQQVIEERGLAGPQESGEQDDRHPPVVPAGGHRPGRRHV